MGRPLRIEFEGAWYHVMNRGRRSERIFEDRKDYQRFVDLMEEINRIWNSRISAYCLMSNHYHLVIYTPRGNIFRIMRHLNGIYTQRFNRTHGLDRALFRGRYKAIIIEADSYLLPLVRYIHRNPLKAGLVTELDQYQWSSHKGYLSKTRAGDWLNKDFVFDLLTAEKGNRIRAYRRYMEEEDSEDIVELFKKKEWPVFLGEERFVYWLRREFFSQKRHPQIPESAALAPGLEVIKEEICRYYGISISELVKPERGRVNEPRNMAIYFTRRLRQEGLKEIAKEYGLKGYSSISSVLQGLEKQFL